MVFLNIAAWICWNNFIYREWQNVCLVEGYRKSSSVLLGKKMSLCFSRSLCVFVCGLTGLGPAARLCPSLLNLISQMDAQQRADCSFDPVHLRHDCSLCLVQSCSWKCRLSFVCMLGCTVIGLGDLGHFWCTFGTLASVENIPYAFAKICSYCIFGIILIVVARTQLVMCWVHWT